MKPSGSEIQVEVVGETPTVESHQVHPPGTSEGGHHLMTSFC